MNLTNSRRNRVAMNSKKRFPLLSEKGVAVNKKRQMKSPTGSFNSGNSLGCHFQHFSAKERVKLKEVCNLRCRLDCILLFA